MLTPDDLHAALRAYTPREVPALPGRRNHLRAGVLAPIVWRPEPELILMLRTSRMRLHAREVSYPGGRPEPDDADLYHTATREAAEELGLVVKRRLGALSSIPLYTSDYRLVPFVAEVEDRPLVPNPDEVAAPLRLSLPELLGRPHFDAIPFVDPDTGESHLSPVFDLDGKLLYGGTAHSVLELLGLAAPLLGSSLPILRPGRFEWSDMPGLADDASAQSTTG